MLAPGSPIQDVIVSLSCAPVHRPMASGGSGVGVAFETAGVLVAGAAVGARVGVSVGAAVAAAVAVAVAAAVDAGVAVTAATDADGEGAGVAADEEHPAITIAAVTASARPR